MKKFRHYPINPGWYWFLTSLKDTPADIIYIDEHGESEYGNSSGDIENAYCTPFKIEWWAGPVPKPDFDEMEEIFQTKEAVR